MQRGAVPVVVDLAGRNDGGHIAVLGDPDAQRFPHPAFGDGIEATRLVWPERQSLEPLRALNLDIPEVFEDRCRRPWRLLDGRTALATVRSGPAGAWFVVVAASPSVGATLEVAIGGPVIGTRNRWLFPPGVEPADAERRIVHTPHAGVVQRAIGRRAKCWCPRWWDSASPFTGFARVTWMSMPESARDRRSSDVTVTQ